MKTSLRWIALVLGLAVCFGVSYAAYTLATYSWNQVVDYRGPYAKVALPQTYTRSVLYTPPAGHEPRLVYVIIDGLRVDVSRKMPTLNTLRAHGYDGVVRTSQPSLSFPNWTTLLSGAPQRISGVTTNWFEGRAPVETLVDVAVAASRTVAVSAPKDFEMLFGVKRTGHVFLRDWTAGQYMTGEIVDHAISLASGAVDASGTLGMVTVGPTLIIVHFPDVDEAGHSSGGASKEYLDTAMKVDTDLGRLVSALQDTRTTFVVTADHGHIDSGGHGGPEDIVTLVPAVFAGPNVKVGAGEGTQDQVAPTVADLAGLPAPRNATGRPLDVSSVVSKDALKGDRFDTELSSAFDAYTAAVAGAPPTAPAVPEGAAESARFRAAFDAATNARLARERSERLPIAAGVALAALLLVVVVGLMSWCALASAGVGTLAYYLVYDGLYFGVHRYGVWSLSSFNSESLLKGFMNARMIEAAVAGAVAAIVAGFAYATLRSAPKRPKREYLPGWLALGVATVLVIQATLVVQVAWYLWWWGASLSWYIPDLSLGFKYDLDLIQLTALGGAALLAPLLTYLVGRYHPLRQPKAAAGTTEATSAA